MAPERTTAANAAGSASGLVYFLGILGAWFYFWPLAEGFWEHLYAIFQGVFWPAYLVFEMFEALR